MENNNVNKPHEDKLFFEQIIERGRDWDLANNCIYRLFKENFEHDPAQKIIAKTWILGKTYSVALDRGRKKKNKGEDIDGNTFYSETIPKKIQWTELDDKLNHLKKKFNKIEYGNLKEILSVHNSLSEQIHKISGQSTSFASKYLHFHLPELYFIYDSFAKYNQSEVLKRIPDYKSDLKNSEYSEFVLKCLYLRERIKTKIGKELSPREMDDFLLYINDNDLKIISKHI